VSCFGIDAYDRQYDGAISSEIMLLSSIITTNSSMTTKQTADSTFQAQHTDSLLAMQAVQSTSHHD